MLEFKIQLNIIVYIQFTLIIKVLLIFTMANSKSFIGSSILSVNSKDKKRIFKYD